MPSSSDYFARSGHAIAFFLFFTLRTENQHQLSIFQTSNSLDKLSFSIIISQEKVIFYELE